MGKIATVLWIAGLFVAGSALAAEPVSFSKSTAALLPADTATPFFSGVAMGVVDVDRDGRDDIVRFQRGRGLRIEYQAGAGEAFVNDTGHTFTDIRVAVAVADIDWNGKRDLLSGGYSGGLHILAANADGSGIHRIAFSKNASFWAWATLGAASRTKRIGRRNFMVVSFG